MGSKTGKHLFQKGVCPNPGGKPKVGKPGRNKIRARLKVQEILEMMDFRPFEEMVNLYRDEKTKARQKVDILIELCSYVAPKLKHVEISGDNENPFIINLNIERKRKEGFITNQLIGEIVDDDEEDK